jgi:hypothetical protein
MDIDASQEQVVQGFAALSAKGARTIVVETVSLQSRRCLAPAMQGKPDEHETLVRGPGLPELFDTGNGCLPSCSFVSRATPTTCCRSSSY